MLSEDLDAGYCIGEEEAANGQEEDGLIHHHFCCISNEAVGGIKICIVVGNFNVPSYFLCFNKCYLAKVIAGQFNSFDIS